MFVFAVFVQHHILAIFFRRLILFCMSKGADWPGGCCCHGTVKYMYNVLSVPIINIELIFVPRVPYQ